MQTYLLTCIIIFLASFIKGLSGFAALLIAIPLLALFLDIKTIIPLVTLVSFSVSLLLIIELKKKLDLRKIYPFLIGTVPGIPLGVYLLKRLDSDVILFSLGVILIAYSLFGLFSKPIKREMAGKYAYLFGLVAGCLGGGLSLHGPIVIVYTSLQRWNKDEIKVTMQGFFLISAAIVIIFHAVSGLTNITVLRFFGLSLPGVLIGNYLGSHLYGRLKEAHYTQVIFVLLGLLGVLMIYRNL